MQANDVSDTIIGIMHYFGPSPIRREYRNVRVELRTASRETPTSAMTASHMVAKPTAPSARKAN
jgi:hypothetical protein